MKYILIALFALSSLAYAEEAAKPETPKEETPAPVEVVLDKKAILALAEEMSKLKADKTMTDALREEKLSAMSPVGKKFSLDMTLTNVSKKGSSEYYVCLEDRNSTKVTINHKSINSVSYHPKELIDVSSRGKYSDMAIRTVGKKYTVTGKIKTFNPEVFQCEEKKKNKAVEAMMNVDDLVLTE